MLVRDDFIFHGTLQACPKARDDGIVLSVAIVEVADLVREGNVIAVGRPRHSRVRAGSGVHRMKGVWPRFTSCCIWVEDDLRKAVCFAGRHAASLATRQVLNHHMKAGGGVEESHNQCISWRHKESL